MHRGAANLRASVTRAIVLAVVALLVIACHRTKRYESNVEITRMTPVRKDADGKVLTLDFELSYADCPGTQTEVIRGDATFAACVGKHKVGDRVVVGIEHLWTEGGYWTWQVRKVGDCERVIDPADEASYAMVRECDDWVINGTRVGFQCKYIPEKKLIDKCPWFRRH